MNNYKNYQFKQVNREDNDNDNGYNNNVLSKKSILKKLQRVIYLAKSGDLSGAVQSLYSHGFCPLTPKIKNQISIETSI